VTLICSAAGCSSSSGDARQQVLEACKVATLNPDDALQTGSVGETLKSYQQAHMHSAKAASEDPQWISLNQAYGTLIAEWSAIEGVTGPSFRQGDYESAQEVSHVEELHAQWDVQEERAETNVRTQCAVATA
jgi:hypothetical protein